MKPNLLLRGRAARLFVPLSAATALLAGAAALSLNGCGQGNEAAAPADMGTSVRQDEFCAPLGLSPALRHTVILVDVSALKDAAPEEFAARNGPLLKLVQSLAFPDLALQSGASVPRERISLIAASPRTGNHSTVFTGCLPGMSEQEIMKADKGGAFDKYMGSDLNSRLAKDREAFQRQIIISLMRMKGLAEQASAASDDQFSSSTLVRLLKPLPPPATDDSAIRRVFVYTDIGRTTPKIEGDIAAVRTAAFEQAKKTSLHLGLSEISIVGSEGGAQLGLAEDYFRAFLLGSQGQLKDVGGFSPNGASPAPVSLSLYRGTLKVTGHEMPMTLRLAADSRGRLVGSWISYTASSGIRATPLTGDFICTAERDCLLKSSPEGGLGQLWRLSGGEEPEAREDAPFGGLRFLEATEKPSGMEGKISDPVISIGEPGGGMSFSIKRIAKPG